MEDRNTGEALEYSEQRSFRGQLQITPSDTFSAWLKLEYNDLNLFQLYKRWYNTK